MRWVSVLATSLLLAAAAVAAHAATPQPALPTNDQIDWHPDRPSRSVGQPWKGRLVNGVHLPLQGQDFFTWDFPLNGSPNRPWRRWGTDRLLWLVLNVLHDYRVENPGAPRVGIGDISRRYGGNFGARYGGLGHQSHQNGRDIDILYPRLDGQELRPSRVSQIDSALAQDLVDRFVAAQVQYVFVGPHTGLTGPRKIVFKLRFHDDHLHVRVW
jgi:murein endopeptidase